MKYFSNYKPNKANLNIMSIFPSKLKFIVAILIIYLGQIVGFIAPAIFYETPMHSARFLVSNWAINKAIIASTSFLSISIIFSTLIIFIFKDNFNRKINPNYLFIRPEFTSIFLLFIGVFSTLYCGFFSINSSSVRYFLYILTWSLVANFIYAMIALRNTSHPINKKLILCSAIISIVFFVGLNIFLGGGFYNYAFMIIVLLFLLLNPLKVKWVVPSALLLIIFISLGLAFKNYIRVNFHGGGFAKFEHVKDVLDYQSKIQPKWSYENEVTAFLSYDSNYRNMKLICSTDKSFTPCFILGRILQRSELLAQLGRVIELTPSQVPYLEGITYIPIIYIPIIRPLWPDKPSDITAQYFGIQYGYKDVNDPNPTTILSNVVFEAWMNGGWKFIIFSAIVYGSILGLVLYGIFIKNVSINLIAYITIPSIANFNSSLFQVMSGTLHFAIIYTLLFVILSKISILVRK